jgi:hypothetical protein
VITKLIFRLYLLFKGKAYQHWRYYGRDYKVMPAGQQKVVDYRGLQLSVSTPDCISINEKKVIILCSGPSVKLLERPIEQWGLPIIAMNGSHSLYQGQDRMLDYYVVSDIGFIRRQWQSFKRGISISKMVMLDHRALSEVLKIDPSALEDSEIVVFNQTKRPYGRPLTPNVDSPSDKFYCKGGSVFSLNPELGYASSGTVAYLALQLVATMGFNDIRFLGLDLCGDGRFFNEARVEKSHLDDDYNSLIEPDFRVAADICKRLNITLRNGALNSRLPSDVMQRYEGQLMLDL